MELSRRLQAVADLASDSQMKADRNDKGKSFVVADIGCDHGYIPIYMIEQSRADYAIAMDINEGPLEKAKEHIRIQEMTTYIETRLSDGLRSLQSGEIQTAIIAGMGGGLIIKILEQDQRLWKDIHSFVLQPQSELAKVRAYLFEQGFVTIAEDMVLEDGKYYPMMKVSYNNDFVVHGKEFVDCLDEMDSEYGPMLLRMSHPVLKQYLEREIQMKESVLSSLGDKTGNHIQVRIQELNREVRRAKDALQRYYS